MELRSDLLAGGNIVASAPIFVQNNENILIAWKNVLQSYNTKTSKLITEYKGLTESVFAFGVYTLENTEYVTACSTVGEVVTWIVLNGLKIYKHQLKLTQLKTFNLIGSTPSALITHFNPNQQTVKFQRLDIQTGLLKDVNFVAKLNSDFFIATNSSMFAVVHKSHLYVVYFNAGNLIKNGIDKLKRFTCVTCHMDDSVVLTGDSLGRILLWRNFTKTGQAIHTVFHWHSCPVRAIAFTSSGNYFYSGGSENVLVRWEVNNANERKFLPRMSDEIRDISVSTDNSLIAVATADNAVQILDSEFTNVSAIQHLVTGNNYQAGLTYDFNSKLLILNGIPGHLQFFSIQTGNMLYNLDVVNQNRVTGEENLTVTDITNIAVDDKGQWLVTVEKFKNTLCHEIRLKFWHFNASEQQYVLHTCLEYPHETSINAIVFQPIVNDQPQCVSISKKQFRIWGLETMEERTVWMRMRSGFYRGFDANCLQYSHDGSLIAIGFNHVITIWSSGTCELKCTLAQPQNDKNVTAVHFGVASECHLLVSTTKQSLSVWNLLSLSLTWTINLNVDVIISNPRSHLMALFTPTHVYVFTPSTSPKLIHHQTINAKVKAATFITTPARCRNDHCKIVTLNEHSELYVLSNVDDDFVDIPLASEDNEEEDRSLFAKVLSSVKVDGRSELTREFTNAIPHNVQLKRLLDVPAHTMPPVQAVCENILNVIVRERK